MKKTFWLTFDFGIKADYEGLYRWLDENNAEERGYGTAYLKNFKLPKLKSKTVKTDIEFKALMKGILEENVDLNKSDRIYIMWRGFNDQKMKGSFLFGGKKAAPWVGFSQSNDDIIDNDFD